MQKVRIIIIILIVFFAILVFFIKTTSIPIFSNIVQSIFGPAKSVLYKTRISATEENKIIKENEDLKKKLLDFEKIKRDNIALHDQFETGLTEKYTMLPSKIIGTLGSFTNPSELIIDQGENSGVKVGMAVIVKSNLIGKVEKTSENFSKVMLISSANFSTLARSSETDALGVVRGRQDFVLFENVSINDSIAQKQIVFTRGQINEDGFGIPPDLIIGEISQVDRNESLPTQSAKVDAQINISKLETVFVIIK